MIEPQDSISSAFRSAAALRAELLSLGWPTTAQVDKLLSADAESAAQKRRQGELLGVWADVCQDFVYPSFQFQNGTINPTTKELLAALASIPGFASTDDPGGWRRAFWLYGASSVLDGRVPAQVFETDPQRVISLALAEAVSNPSDCW